jgi:hypothetical protein
MKTREPDCLPLGDHFGSGALLEGNNNLAYLEQST